MPPDPSDSSSLWRRFWAHLVREQREYRILAGCLLLMFCFRSAWADWVQVADRLHESDDYRGRPPVG